jgi:hypothetical protein
MKMLRESIPASILHESQGEVSENVLGTVEQWRRGVHIHYFPLQVLSINGDT